MDKYASMWTSTNNSIARQKHAVDFWQSLTEDSVVQADQGLTALEGMFEHSKFASAKAPLTSKQIATRIIGGAAATGMAIGGAAGHMGSRTDDRGVSSRQRNHDANEVKRQHLMKTRGETQPSKVQQVSSDTGQRINDILDSHPATAPALGALAGGALTSLAAAKTIGIM